MQILLGNIALTGETILVGNIGDQLEICFQYQQQTDWGLLEFQKYLYERNL